jgi:dihydroneopterin aldolase
MDIVFIRGLRIQTKIGIHDWEQQIDRPIVLDLELATEVARGAASDRIEDALDYEAVTKRLTEFVSGSHYALVETLAERCAALLMDELAIPWVRIVLNKPGAVGAGVDVGVIIERRKGTEPQGSAT